MLSAVKWRKILFQIRHDSLGKKKMQLFIALELNEKIVASTCVGEIFAISTKGGRTYNARASGKIVDEVKRMKVKAETPSFSYHCKVNAIEHKVAKISITKQIINSVLVSKCLIQIE